MLTLKPYRRAAVPLLAVQTADPKEVLRIALSEQNGSICPVLQWDCIHGITAANTEAQGIASELNQNQDPAITTGNPIEALRSLEYFGDPDIDKAIIVMFGLAGILDDPQSKIPALQAIWNLRDVLPQSGSLLVMTVPMGWVNPYPDDIAVVVSDLPTVDDHIKLALRLCKDADIKPPSKTAQTKIGDALLGLSSFASEQALALSLTKKGIDINSLRERKRQQISETPGLSVYTGQERLSDLGGLAQAKSLFVNILKGKRKPGAVVFVDEIEKSLGNTAGDTSGVSQSMLGYLLTYMQDQNATGSIFVGPPGAAKSAFAKAMGAEVDIPTVNLDLGSTKGSLVGESERQIRTALSVITSISGGKPFFVATCNAISVLPPELRRRFTVGTMFFDLPTADERAVIWDIYCKKFNLDGPIPDSDGWTGAEIRQCADIADRLGMSLIEASKFVVPVSVSAREQIDRLRKEASGRYLSASSDGVYVYEAKTGKRKLAI